MLKTYIRNKVVHMGSGNKLLPELKVRFTENEFETMLEDEIIQKRDNERYEFTPIGEMIIGEKIKSVIFKLIYT